MVAGKIKFFILFFIIIFQISLFSETKISLDLNDNKAEWNIGITALAEKNLSDENRYLAKTIPIKIYQKLLEYKEHYLSDEEMEAFSKTIISDSIFKIKNQLLAYNRELDLLDFNNFDISIQDKKLLKKEEIYKKIEVEYKKLDYLENFDQKKIYIKNLKPIKFINTLLDSSSDVQLLNPIKDKLQLYTKDKNIDLLITGSIEELAGYIYYDIILYSNILDRNLLVIKGGGSSRVIIDELPNNIDKIITIVLGKDWANLTINVKPITASIKVGEQYYGNGIYKNHKIEPGKYAVLIDAPGYIGEEHEVVIQSSQYKTLDIALIKNSMAPVLVTTFPQGADFYLSSMWLGKTPILVETPGINESFLIRKDGFLDYIDVFNISTLSENNYSYDILMKTSIIDIEPYIKSKRAAFYNNLAGLAFAIPITLLSIGFVERFSSSYPTGADATPYSQQKVMTEIGILNSIFAAGLILDVVFLSGLIIDSISYIKVYDAR